MNHPTRLFVAAIALFASACTASSHAVETSSLGTPTGAQRMLDLAPRPASVTVTRIDSARWKVDRAGLINLEHDVARDASLESGLEPIVVSFYLIEHPAHGRFMVDSGVAAAFHTPDDAPVSALVASQMNFEALEIATDTAAWLRDNGPVAGVFLTHIHLDHVMGLPDVPDDTPIYAGPGETEPRAFLNLFTRGTLDELLDGKGAVREWPYTSDPDGQFAGVVDVFGDGTFFAIHAPGHTPGNTAYLARTPDGPVLIAGDTSHTTWGWNHCVEPGEFSHDVEQSKTSLAQLKALENLPNLTVHLGHQHQEGQSETCDDIDDRTAAR